MDRTSAAGLVLAFAAAALVAGCGASKETFNATITYVPVSYTHLTLPTIYSV